MKKTIAIVLVSIMLIFSICPTAFAATNWTNIIDISGMITFSGNTGLFTAEISGNNDVSVISATAKLYYKNSSSQWVLVSTNWNFATIGGYLTINEDFSATRGVQYKVVLTANVYANGYNEPVQKTYTGTC